MARALRVEFPGAIYHVRARGNARHDIVADANHWQRLEEDLALPVVRHGWELLTYVLMTNPLHLLLRPPYPNLSRGMQYFLSRYANWYNRRQRAPSARDPQLGRCGGQIDGYVVLTGSAGRH